MSGSTHTHFLLGLAMFLLGNLFMSYSVVTSPSGTPTKLNPGEFAPLTGASLQTTGMLAMVVCDLDMNVFLASNRPRLVAILLAWATPYTVAFFSVPCIYASAERYGYLGYASVSFPFLYIALRFEQVVHRVQRYPSLTEVFALILACDLLGQTSAWILPGFTFRF